ncbi:MAG: YdcF family protein, partial [Chloroflexota bacterium]
MLTLETRGASSRPSGSRRRIPRRFVALLLFLGACLALVLTASLWLPLLGGYLVDADPLQKADAMASLNGGRDRPVYGAKLFQEGYAEWYLTVDMPLDVPGVDEPYGELVKREVVALGVPAVRVLKASGDVETTYDEAAKLRDLAASRGFRSMLVVTSAYHTHRARLIFQEVLHGTGITAIVRPVENDPYRPDSWWTSERGLRDTWTEYLKLALYYAGY